MRRACITIPRDQARSDMSDHLLSTLTSSFIVILSHFMLNLILILISWLPSSSLHDLTLFAIVSKRIRTEHARWWLTGYRFAVRLVLWGERHQHQSLQTPG